MASTVIKNWDNKTWLSSQNYINSFNNFLIKNININSRFKILDIGCGRGKILGSLCSKLKLKQKPLGIDVVNHKDRDKRINFKRINVLNFSLKKSQKFDLILIKQTIHLFNINKIKKLLSVSKKNLNPNGKICIFTLDPINSEIPTFNLMNIKLQKSLRRDKKILNIKGKIIIFTLDTENNEIPTFKLMKLKLNKSLLRDKKILKIITNLYPQRIQKKFIFNVRISKKKYLDMIKNRYISTLIPLSKKQLIQGIKEIELNYKNKLKFKDKLTCIIL